MSRRAGRTLAAAAEVCGVGLHSGAWSRVRLVPATAADGISFLLPAPSGATLRPRIRAAPHNVVSTRLSTTLGDGKGATTGTVEHLMAALSGAGLTACTVDIQGGAELPILDGSALPWLEAICSAGVAPLSEAPMAVVLRRPIRVQQGSSFVIALPADEPQLTCGIDFGGGYSGGGGYSEEEAHYKRGAAAIGRQWASWRPESGGNFAAELAPARTFALEDHVDTMRREVP